MDIGNIDETPVYLEMLGTITHVSKGDSEVSIYSTCDEKQKLTVILVAFVDGTKIAPLVHLPGVRPSAKNVCCAGQKSWVNEQNILFWLSKLWGLKNTSKRMFVWDTFRAHLTTAVRSIYRKHVTQTFVIPGGCMSKLHLADVSWNRPFKMKMSELYDKWLFEGNVEKTPKGDRRPPTKSLVLQWIEESWACITPDTIRKSFKKCGISSALYGSQDHLLQPSDDDQEGEAFEGLSSGRY